MKEFHNKSNKHVTKIVLKVEDIDRSLNFYKNIMGFKILKKEDKEIVLTADGINPIIELIQPKDVIKKIPKRTGLYHFAILLPNRLQLGLFLKNINEKNYPIDGGANHNVSEAIYLKDPDDNGIEIYSDIDSNKWTWKNNKVKMTTEILDYKDLLDLAEDNKWDGMPKETVIGHIHLHVSDLEKAKDFYVNGLGFNISSEIKKSALFLSTADYHHHIAINIWNGTNIDPLPKNSVGMKYYAIKFPDEDSKKTTVNKLEKIGYKVIEKDTDVYTKDPSGNLIKLII